MFPVHQWVQPVALVVQSHPGLPVSLSSPLPWYPCILVSVIRYLCNKVSVIRYCIRNPWPATTAARTTRGGTSIGVAAAAAPLRRPAAFALDTQSVHVWPAARCPRGSCRRWQALPGPPLRARTCRFHRRPRRRAPSLTRLRFPRFFPSGDCGAEFGGTLRRCLPRWLAYLRGPGGETVNTRDARGRPRARACVLERTLC